MASFKRCLPACFLLAVVPACKDDLCQSQPPAMEVTITLGDKFKDTKIKTLHINVTAGTFHRIWSFQITDELSDGETSLAVALNPAEASGFDATVLVRAMNAKKEEVARGQKTFPGSGDACNFFDLVLGTPALDGGGGDAGDGGVDLGADAGDSGPDISDVGLDRSPDQKKPDMLPDATPPDLCPSGDFAGSKKTCTKDTDCDDKLACTVDICGGCVCYNVVQVGRCLVGGACHTAGEINSKDTCRRCEPSSSPTSWTLFSAPGCVTTLAGDGINGLIDGPAASSRFNEPFGVATYKNGSVHVADHYNNKLRVIDKVGDVKTVSNFYLPDGVDLDDNGIIYLADSIYHQITTFDGGMLKDIAGKLWVPGQDNGPAASATFNGPTDIAVDRTGKVYVADTGNHLIRLIDNGIVSTLAGSGKAGSNDGKGTAATFKYPHGVALDNKGTVYVADRGNHVIRKIQIKDGEVSTLAGTLGKGAGYNDSTTAAAALFYKPTGVAVDNTGKVYVADNGNHLIRMIDTRKNNEVSTRAGMYKLPGHADGEFLSARFNTPRRLAVDAFGMVQVADRLNHKVRTIHTWGYWVVIKAGTFTMGSPPGEPGRDTDEIPHEVTLTNNFEILATEVTHDQFFAVMGYEPWYFKYCGGTCPVENVSWHEAVAFCNALSTKAGQAQCYIDQGSGNGCTKDLDCATDESCSNAICVKYDVSSAYPGNKIYSCPGYRLPTEAEWEYAYRAGTTTAFYSGTINGKLCSSVNVKDPNADKIGFYCANSSVTYAGCQKPSFGGCIGPHPVGSKQANTWDLYDMAGNVSEWCHDQYQLKLVAATDPVGVGTKGRVTRGGPYWYFSKSLRAADRNIGKADVRHMGLGFRCARSIIKSP